jgi:hypothetical protein
MQRLSKDKKQSEPISMYFTPEEYKKIRSAASGQKIGTFCRNLILKAVDSREESK